MCLAIPSKIVNIADNIATIDVDGVTRTCSLLLMEDAAIGDWVIVHAGFAIHRVDEVAAKESLNILREAAAAAEKANDPFFSEKQATAGDKEPSGNDG